MKELKVALFGLGNVGRNMLDILSGSMERIRNITGTRIEVAFASDSTNSYSVPSDIFPAKLKALKESGRLGDALKSVALEEILSSDVDALVDVSSASGDGLREKSLYLSAIRNRKHIVTANKSPLALHWKDIFSEAEKHRVSLLHEATVAGGLPLFNLSQYSCGPSQVIEFRGIVSLTANYVLKLMQSGLAFEEAVRRAQEMGIAEANFADDTTGLDAARKAVILANALFGKSLSLNDINYTGIDEIPPQNRKNDSQMRLVTELSGQDGNFQLFSGFRHLHIGDYLLTLGEHSVGYEIRTDNSGTLRISSLYDGPRETASAVVNDLMLLARKLHRSQ